MALSAAQISKAQKYNAEQARVGQWRPRAGINPASAEFVALVESTQILTNVPNVGLHRLTVDGALGPNTYAVILTLLAVHNGTGRPDDYNYAADPAYQGSALSYAAIELGRAWKLAIQTGYPVSTTFPDSPKPTPKTPVDNGSKKPVDGGGKKGDGGGGKVDVPPDGVIVPPRPAPAKKKGGGLGMVIGGLAVVGIGYVLVTSA